MTKFLVVDDHLIIRLGLKNIILNNFSNSEYDEAHNGDSAIEKIKMFNFDFIFLDMNMPNTDFHNLIHIIKQIRPKLKILIFTFNSEFIFAKKMFQYGIDGFLNKGCDEISIISAIKLILDNNKFISSELKEHFANEMIDGLKENPINSLSKRELEIALHIVKGVSLIEVCNILNLKQSTVATHKTTILTKCNVKNIIELYELFKHYNII